jgi:hypothetical protein
MATAGEVFWPVKAGMGPVFCHGGVDLGLAAGAEEYREAAAGSRRTGRQETRVSCLPYKKRIFFSS